MNLSVYRRQDFVALNNYIADVVEVKPTGYSFLDKFDEQRKIVLERDFWYLQVSGLTCRGSTNWAISPYIGGLPILSTSLFGGGGGGAPLLTSSFYILPISKGSRPSYDTTWEQAVGDAPQRDTTFLYKYHVINHKGNYIDDPILSTSLFGGASYNQCQMHLYQEEGVV